jgi:hypothetical protein
MGTRLGLFVYDPNAVHAIFQLLPFGSGLFDQHLGGQGGVVLTGLVLVVRSRTGWVVRNHRCCLKPQYT